MSGLAARPSLLVPDVNAVVLAAAPTWVKPVPRAYPNSRYGAEGCLSLLTREQDRRLRAAAWRHVRRIHARVARRIWVAVRARQRAA